MGGAGLIVARMDMLRRSKECCLPDLIRETTGHWEEVGTVDRVTIDDYRAAIVDEEGAFNEREFPGVLFYAEPTQSAEEKTVQRATIAELAALKREHDMTLVCELGAATLVDLTKHGIEGVPNVKQAITDGADLVVMNVELLGIPRCAIVLGSKKILEKVRHRGTVAQLAPTPGESTLAALASVLAHCQSTEAMVLTVPILELLSVSAENLKNRAERLAPQLAILDDLRSATPVESTVTFRTKIPSWKIVIDPETMPAAALATKLAQAEPAIMADVEDDKVTLDLRTIFARQDVEIVGIFEKVLGIDQEEE
jgi:L-seryl-tRNA(Ser) seleniumtransferase